LPITGQVFFVDTVNGVDAGTGNGPNNPYQTLTYALLQAPAGSTIYVMAGSTITISSTTSLVVATAGISVVGLGYGRARPLFDFTTANTATIAINAANVTFANMRFRGGFLSIAAAFTLTTATGFSLISNMFYDASAILNFLNIVKSTGAANTVDSIRLIDNTWRGLGTTSVNSFFLTANDIDGAILQDNNVILARTATAAVLMTVTAGVLTNAIVTGNTAISQQTADTGGGFINVGGTTSSGVVANNYLGDLSTTDLFVTTNVGLRFFNNYKTGVVTASGYLLPAADS
jgi:hypothetical protein